MAKKQPDLNGMEAPSIPDLEDAAEAYVKARDARMRLTLKEVEAKTKLLDVTLAHESELSVTPEGDRVYRYDDEIVILKARRNVKVKTARDEEEDEDDE